MRRAALAAIFLFSTTLPVAAQEVQPPPSAEAGDMAAAKAALDRMSARLRSLDTFDLVVDSTDEEVFSGGEKLQFINRIHYTFQRPDHLYASVRSDRRWRRFFYNGQQLTIVAPRSAIYATVPLSGTVAEILNEASEQYGVEVPLMDLFRWGSQQGDPVELTDAFLVGYAQVGEFATNQFFYRAEGVDFQLWIGRDDDLVHRVVITNTEDEAQPQYVANLTWNLTPTIDASRFTYTPPDQGAPVPLRKEGEQLAGSTNGGQP